MKSKEESMNVVILIYESIEANFIVKYLLEHAQEYKISVIVKSTTIVYRKNTWEIAKMFLQGISFNFVLFKLLQTYAWKIGQLVATFQHQTYHIPSLKNLQKEYRFRLFETQDVNQEEMVRQIKKIRPDVLLSVYFNQKIGSALIRVSKKACLNIHPAFLPKYRGLFPYFWVLKNRESMTGVTVHHVANSFDSGNIITQRKVKLPKSATAMKINSICTTLGAKLALNALNRLSKRRILGSKQKSHATYYSWPTNWDYIDFRRQGLHLFHWKNLWNLCINQEQID